MKYGKLVRDKIPEIIEASGSEVFCHIADDSEYWSKLKEKLLEEVHEFFESEEPEELADIYEVLLAIQDFIAVSSGELETLITSKAAARGGFRGRIILDETKP